MGNLGTARTRGARETNRESGVALVLSLVLVTVVAILSAGVVQISSTTSRMEGRSVDQLRAFYLAEAGLAESFAAVRIGRSGEIGEEDNMATYGEGQVWVSAVETSDGRIWLQSTGMAGSGKATLGLVVNPTDPPLGFFSDEDLTIEEGVLVDGFDSTERAYEEEILVLNGLEPTEETITSVFGPDEVWMLASTGHFDPYEPIDWYTGPIVESTVSDKVAGTTQAVTELDEFTQADTSTLWSTGLEPLYYEPKLLEAEAPVLDVTNTSRGGMLGSNGSIDFSGTDPALVFGSVVPGRQSEVEHDSNLVVTESTSSRSLPAELDPVEVPSLPTRSSIRQDDLAPVVISASDGDYDLIAVAENCELILRGPARLSVDVLSLAPGASLTLDTRDGDVDLFITGEMSCSPGSMVETTGRRSSEVRIQGATNALTGAGADLEFSAQSSFYGTIYAPDSTVKIGQPFEVFGSIVAKRLEVEAGSRLHFDNKAYNGNAALPTQEAWRILDLPDSVRRSRRPGSNAGLDELAHAHHLEDVQLSIRYVDASGAAQNFTGPESTFNWASVASVSSIERDVDYRLVNSAEERELREQWTRRVTSKGATLQAAAGSVDDSLLTGAAGAGGALDEEPSLDAAATATAGAGAAAGAGTAEPVTPEPVTAEPVAAEPPVSINATRQAVELATLFGVRSLEITLSGGITGRIWETPTGGEFEVTDVDGAILYYGTIDEGGGVSVLTP